MRAVPVGETTAWVTESQGCKPKNRCTLQQNQSAAKRSQDAKQRHTGKQRAQKQQRKANARPPILWGVEPTEKPFAPAGLSHLSRSPAFTHGSNKEYIQRVLLEINLHSYCISF